MLGWQYVSTDALIEEICSRPIPQIVKEHGWPAFRQYERQAISGLKDIENAVIDCGGGVVENAGNMEILLPASLVVWVDADEGDIFKRLSGDENRPLLNQLNLRQDIETNYQHRQPLYRKYSKIKVNSSNNSVDEICKMVIQNLEKDSGP